MSIADALRFREIETAVAELIERVEALEKPVGGRQDAEASAGVTPASLLVLTTEGPPSAPINDAVAVLAKHGAQKGNRNAAREKPENKGSKTIFKGRGALYTLARLDRDRPDLAQRVRTGELSAHAAAVAAGFRKRMISVPADADAATD